METPNPQIVLQFSPGPEVKVKWNFYQTPSRLTRPLMEAAFRLADGVMCTDTWRQQLVVLHGIHHNDGLPAVDDSEELVQHIERVNGLWDAFFAAYTSSRPEVVCFRHNPPPNPTDADVRVVPEAETLHSNGYLSTGARVWEGPLNTEKDENLNLDTAGLRFNFDTEFLESLNPKNDENVFYLTQLVCRLALSAYVWFAAKQSFRWDRVQTIADTFDKLFWGARFGYYRWSESKTQGGWILPGNERETHRIVEPWLKDFATGDGPRTLTLPIPCAAVKSTNKWSTRPPQIGGNEYPDSFSMQELEAVRSRLLNAS